MNLLLLSLRAAALPACLTLALSCPVAAGVSAPYQLLTNTKNVIVWQGFDPWLMITEDLAAGRACYYYDPQHHTRLTFNPGMPGSWTPLGSAIKWLMYMDHYQGLDRLMAHDVDIHVNHIARPSTEKQVGCGMTGPTCVYGQYGSAPVGDHYPVSLWRYDLATAECVQVTSSDSEKSQFAHDGNLIVYRAHYGPGDNRIRGCYFGGGEIEIAARDGIEPSVCGTLVAWAEANGSGWDIVAKDTGAGELRAIAYTTAAAPRPEAGQEAVFWQTVGATSGLDISGYDWQTRQVFVVTSAAGDQQQLRVCDDLVTWVTGPTDHRTLWGANIQPPVPISDFRATLVTQDSVGLSWTSPGSTQNPPVSYEMRTRPDSPVTQSNWADSAPLTGLPAPQSPGQTETLTAQALNAGTHHFALKARLNDGSETLLSENVCAYVSSAPDALNAPLGAFISFPGVVTGTGVDGAIYAQTTSGVGAIRALTRASEPSPGPGQLLTVTGVLTQTPDLIGPVLAQATLNLDSGAQQPRCFAMSAGSVGGFSARFGGTDQRGAPNTWMPAKVWGRVSGLTTAGGCSFYIDDGSNLPDNSGRGIYVSSRFAPPPGLCDGCFATAAGVVLLSSQSGRRLEVVCEGMVQLAQ